MIFLPGPPSLSYSVFGIVFHNDSDLATSSTVYQIPVILFQIQVHSLQRKQASQSCEAILQNIDAFERIILQRRIMFIYPRCDTPHVNSLVSKVKVSGFTDTGHWTPQV